MSFLDAIALLAAFFSVWLPVIIAIFARRSPVGVRVVFAVSGIVSGIYAATMHSQVGHASGHDRGWGMLLIPLSTLALSFWLAFTGVSLVTVTGYLRAGRPASAPSLLACGFVLGSIVLGIVVVFPFLTWPLS